MGYSLTINCFCGKQMTFSFKNNSYYCSDCGRVYLRTYHIEDGEYVSTFKVMK